MKFEYKVARAAVNKYGSHAMLGLQDLLTFYGDRGWAVVTMWPDTAYFRGFGVWVVFERPADGGDDGN